MSTARTVCIDRETKKWIRNTADQKAAEAEMIFDAQSGQFVCDWIEKYCCLYEGSHAGEPLKLMDWQRDFTMRLFGWRRWSSEWNEWIRRFTKASLWAAKKNGKTPFIAALGLYLLAGDNEPGQKIYAAAKNGEQAKLSQQHAIAMVEQSPALDYRQGGDCKINKSNLEIHHVPTRSKMVRLTGDDERGQKAKEGINGSVMIDECHVFDREMHERTSRAGISRKEPLNLSVSTAGDDPSSYGFERYEYGRQVNAGERNDPHCLHVDYSAPENITDAEIERRLDEFAKMANPAWGHIVKASELRSDWESCKGKPREIARFKQYRLNVWVGSTNPWLSIGGWEKGKRDVKREQLRRRTCNLGIDLSRTRDMTSAVFLFDWDDEEGPERLLAWPMFWLPQTTANERDHLFPFKSWAAANQLKLTTGDVVDYRQVEEEIVAEVEDLELIVRAIFFDQKYAEELTQRLAERLGCERVAVPQSLMGLTPLAKELERRVIAGYLLHPGNRVLSWQVGHVQVFQDANQNIRPIKPRNASSGKSIDGVMALLDTFAGVVSPDTVARSEPTITFI